MTEIRTVFNEFEAALNKVIRYPMTKMQADEYNNFFNKPYVEPGATKRFLNGMVTGNMDGSVTYKSRIAGEGEVLLAYGPDPLDFCEKLPGYRKIWEGSSNAGFAEEQKVKTLLDKLREAISSGAQGSESNDGKRAIALLAEIKALLK